MFKTAPGCKQSQTGFSLALCPMMFQTRRNINKLITFPKEVCIPVEGGQQVNVLLST